MKKQKQKKGGFNWIGTLIFLILVFGPQLVPFISRLTGGTITPSMIIPILIGGIIAVATLVSVVRAINGASEQAAPPPPTPSPTKPTPTLHKERPTSSFSRSHSSSSSSWTSQQSHKWASSDSDWASSFPPPRTRDAQKMSSRSGIGSQNVPGPPQFEPIIDPTVLAIGLVGIVILGGLLTALYLFSSFSVPLP